MVTRVQESSRAWLLAGQAIVLLTVALWSASQAAPVLPRNCPAQCNADCAGKGASCRAKVEVLCADTAPGMNDRISVCRGYYESCNAAETSCSAGCGVEVGDCSEEEEESEEEQQPEEEEGESEDADNESATDPGEESGTGNEGSDGGSGSGAGAGAGGGSGGGAAGGSGSGAGSGSSAGAGSSGGSGGGSGSGAGGDSGSGPGGEPPGLPSGPPGIPGWPPSGGGNVGSGNVNVCVGDGACSQGDPHLTSFDRVRFDFQGAGEYHFALSDEHDIDIQVRYSPAHPSRYVSLTTAVAARVGPNRITIDPGRARVIEINGEPVLVRSGLSNTLDHESGLVILREHDKYRINMTRGVVISIYSLRTYMNLGVVSSEHPVRGLGGSNDGNANNEFTTRDGETLMPVNGELSYAQLYRQFGDSWRIAQEDSLFDYADGESTETYSLQDFPLEHLDLRAMDDAARLRAEAICREAGIAPGAAFDDCVYDVGFTGDAIYAKGYVDPLPNLVASLDAPANVTVGSAVTIQWSGPANENDYVALAGVGQPGSQFRAYSYLDETGEVELRAPGIPGDYELRYVLNADRQIIEAIPLTVNAVTATLDGPAAVGAGSRVQVQWTGPANENDFVALSSVGQAGSEYRAYSYLDETGEVELRAPGIPGDYELRYVLNADRQIIEAIPLTVNAVTATLEAPAAVEAGSNVVVRWSGPANENDFVAIAEPGSPGNQYQNYAYVTSGESAVELPAPNEAGEYVLRYIVSSDRQVVAEISLTVN